ncbi:ectoine synthase [Ewingella sp. AOP8-B2-18]
MIKYSISGYGLLPFLIFIKEKYDTWSPGEHNEILRGNNDAFITAHSAVEKYWKDNPFIKEIENSLSRYLCVFNPPVTGNEDHDEDGSYKLS